MPEDPAKAFGFDASDEEVTEEPVNEIVEEVSEEVETFEL